MGGSISKLDNKETVQLCKDRKCFVKQAIEQRSCFATNHISYIQSLKRVSKALRDYVDEDEPREFPLSSFKTPSSTPVKKTHSNFISISPKRSFQINHQRPQGNKSVVVEEAPPHTSENIRIQSYSPRHHYGFDGFFAMQSSAMNSSTYRPSFPPPSPQNSQWDSFWNPFSSLDYYGYTDRNNLDGSVFDDDITGLRQVREQEGIPELEEETESEEIDKNVNGSKERASNINEVISDNDEFDHIECTDCDSENGHDRDMLKPHKEPSVEVPKTPSVGQVSIKETEMENLENKKETPGFTVYVNQRPTSMVQVIEDLEAQFTIICSAGNVMSAMLEASKAQYYSSSNDFSAMKMLNPVALFGSSSSRSSSSRFLVQTPTSKDESYESNSEFSDKSCMFSGSHQSTLDRLYAWEKKLYDEVRGGERVRIAYEKKCLQLRNKVVRGEEPCSVDKTRVSIRDLYSRIKVSIHSVEAISKRIETLRDEELQPQLQELIQGLGKMWKAVAESHQSQKRTLNEAKLLLSRTPSKQLKTKNDTYNKPPSDPHRLASSASNLETELKNWQYCFQSYIASQRSYVSALTGWLLCCIGRDADTSKLPFCSCPLIYSVCIQWSRLLDAVREDYVMDGLDFFVAGMGSICAQLSREDNIEDNILMSEKIGEIGVKVLCAGMSVTVNSMTEFAMGSAQGYAELIDQSEGAKCIQDMT